VEAQTPLNQEYLIAITKYSTIAFAICVVGITIVACVAFYKNEGKTFSLLIQRSGALQLVTVLTIILAAAFLTVIGKITTEGIVSILSGIAGYVLGGASKIRQGATEQREQN
jgi:hypothetical protein